MHRRQRPGNGGSRQGDPRVRGFFSTGFAVSRRAALPVAAVAPLGLDLQDCALDRASAYMLLASPLLPLGGAPAAFLALRRPALRRLTLMLMPLLVVAGAAALAAGRQRR